MVKIEVGGKVAGTPIRLSEMQSEILCHRLEVSDAIADCLEKTWDRDMVMVVADAIHANIKACSGVRLYVDPLIAIYGYAIVRDVLVDAVTGSTFYGAAIGAVSNRELTELQLANIGKAGESLARKIGERFNQTIEYPLY